MFLISRTRDLIINPRRRGGVAGAGQETAVPAITCHILHLQSPAQIEGGERTVCATNLIFNNERFSPHRMRSIMFQGWTRRELSLANISCFVVFVNNINENLDLILTGERERVMSDSN